MYKLLLLKINRLFALAFPFAVKVYGSWMYYDSLDRFIAILLWKFMLLEKYDIKLFKSYLMTGMNVLDIGGNLGLYSLLASKILKESGQIIAFEPDKEHFATFTKSISKNKVQNIVLHNKAVGNSEQYLSLKKDPFNSGNYQVQNNTSELKEGLEELVEVVSLDNFLKEIPHIDLVKIDIQGFEYFALQGMKEIIRKNPQCIIFSEYWPYGLKKNNLTTSQFIELIISLELKIFTFNKKNKKLCLLPPEQLLTYNNSVSYLNIILSKKDLTSDLSGNP